MVVEYIDAHRGRIVEGKELGVEPICEVLRDAGVQIAASTYYAARTRPASARSVRDAELVEDIKVSHKANLGVYGVRKIHAELNREGITVARCTVERLMRAQGLRGIPREKTRKTTVSGGAQTERPEDLVKRKFVATAPNQLWVFGASGWNWRPTRSLGRSPTGPGTVVRGPLARLIPRNPSLRMRRSTVHRAV